MRYAKIILLLFIASVFMLSGFFVQKGFAQPPKKIKLTFMNPYAPSTNYAPFWSAERRYWPEENIQAKVLDGRGGAAVFQAIASGSAQAGYCPIDVLKAIQQGMPIKIIAVGAQNGAVMIFTLKSSGIKTLKDFEGKTIGEFPFGMSKLIGKALLKRHGVNLDKIKFVNVRPGNEMKLLMAGSIDGSFGLLGYQDLHLTCMGREPIKFVADSQSGFNYYDFFVAVNTKWAKKIGYDGMVRFLRGIAKGFLLRKTNVAQSVEDMIYYRPMQKPFKKIRLAEFWSLLPRMLSPDTKKYGWGVITEKKMKSTQDLLFDIGYLKKKIDVKKYYDDRYLKDPSIQKIAMEFARAPIDPKAEGYFKGCGGQ